MVACLARALAVAGLCLGAAAAPAPASVGRVVPSRVGLAVDTAGDALVAWSERGEPESVLLTATGVLGHAAALPGTDVPKPMTVRGLADVPRSAGHRTDASSGEQASHPA